MYIVDRYRGGPFEKKCYSYANLNKYSDLPLVITNPTVSLLIFHNYINEASLTRARNRTLVYSISWTFSENYSPTMAPILFQSGESYTANFLNMSVFSGNANGSRLTFFFFFFFFCYLQPATKPKWVFCFLLVASLTALLVIIFEFSRQKCEMPTIFFCVQFYIFNILVIQQRLC